MKLSIYLLIISCIYFGGCSVSKKSSDLIVDEANLKNGMLIYLPKKTREGLQKEMEFYFRIEEKNYFVKLSESKVNATELKKHVNQTVSIKGNIKNGPWEEMKATTITSNQYPEKPRSGVYITIDKILEKQDRLMD
jgi:hypothetical protein